MKKIALFLMIMACFMFISCDQITGPVDQGNSEQNGDSPSGSQNGTGGNNGSNAGDQGGTGGNSGTSGDQGVTGGNGGTSGDQGVTGGNGDSSSDQGGTGGNGGSSGGTVIEPTPDIQLPPASEESSKEETKDLLDEAIDLLLDADIDGGIAKIREAYAEQQNNETALYYALAELASISVDESVATLLKENMGIKNYPSKMNSLLSGDWMKEYPIAYDRNICEVTESEDGQYVRVSGTKADYYNDVDISYYLYEGDWVSSSDYLTDVTLDENGDYLVYRYNLPEYIDYSTATRYDAEEIVLGFEEYEYGGFVKFSGTLVEDTSNFISGYSVNENDERIGSVYLENVELSETGDYFVYSWNLSNIDTSSATKYYIGWNDDSHCYIFIESEYGDYVRVTGTDIKVFSGWYYVKENSSWVLKDATFRDVTVGSGDYFGSYSYFNNSDTSSATKYQKNYKSKMVQEGTVSLPEFNVPSWFKDTEYEEKFNSTYTAQSVMYLLMANALECNSKGLNEAFDNILAVFGTKFANAKALAASLTDASVEIPSKVFDAFGLEELLDGQSSLKIGKAELNVLVASMEILKGTFQWLASYDWTLNLSYLKKLFIDYFDSEELIFDAIENTVTKNTLAVRNAQLMTASKNSFLSAISLVESSYSYLVGDTSQYPDVYIDEIKEYGDVYLQGLQSLKKAIQDGGIFFVPDYNWDGISWPKTASNTMMQIDMGKFFTAGYLTDIIDRDASGKVQFYIEIYVYDRDESIFASFNSFETLEEEFEAIITNNGLENAEYYYPSICIALDVNKVYDLLGTSFIDEIFGEEYIGTDTIYFPFVGMKEPVLPPEHNGSTGNQIIN